jgi:hypothetical protein
MRHLHLLWSFCCISLTCCLQLQQLRVKRSVPVSVEGQTELLQIFRPTAISIGMMGHLEIYAPWKEDGFMNESRLTCLGTNS